MSSILEMVVVCEVYSICMNSHKLVYVCSLFSVFKFFIVLYLYKILCDHIHLSLLSIFLSNLLNYFPFFPMSFILPFFPIRIYAGSHSSYVFMIKMVIIPRQQSSTVLPISVSFYSLFSPYLQCFLDLRGVT